MDKTLKYAAYIAAFAAALWSGLAMIYQVLIVVIAGDILSGAIRSFIQKKLDSDVAWNGLAKKVLILFLVAIAAYLQRTVLPITGIPLPEAVAGFYIYMELLSILENVTASGLPVPQVLRDALTALAPQKDIAERAG